MATSTTSTSLRLRDAVRGTLLGAAVADAVGLRTEFLSRDEAQGIVSAARTKAAASSVPAAAGGADAGDADSAPATTHSASADTAAAAAPAPAAPAATAAAAPAPALSMRGWPGREEEDGEGEDKEGGRAHHTLWEEGDWTDDTDQHLLVLQSLVAHAGSVNAADVGRRLSRWMDSGLDFAPFNDTRAVGAGSTTKMVLSHPLIGTRPDLAAAYVWAHPFFAAAAGREPCASASNGSVMRAAVVGAAGAAAGRALLSIASEAGIASRVTHADPRCTAACVFICTLVAQLVRRFADGAIVPVRAGAPVSAGVDAAPEAPPEEAEGETGGGGAEATTTTTTAAFVPPPSPAAVEVMVETSAALAEAALAGELADLPSRMEEVRLAMEEVPQADYRGTGKPVAEEFLKAAPRVRDLCAAGPAFREPWITARTLDALELGPERIGFALKPVGCAVVSLRQLAERAPRNATAARVAVATCIENIVAEGADADTNATVAGAVLGAALGMEHGVPQQWIAELRHADYLAAQSDALVAACTPDPFVPTGPPGADTRHTTAAARFDVG